MFLSFNHNGERSMRSDRIRYLEEYKNILKNYKTEKSTDALFISDTNFRQYIETLLIRIHRWLIV